MKELDIKFNYTEQEASDAYTATLDCTRGKIHMKPSTAIATGGVAAFIALFYFFIGIAPIIMNGIKNTDIFECILRVLFGGCIAYFALHYFALAVQSKREIEEGQTEENLIKCWYSKEGILPFDIQIVFGKRKIKIMPNEEIFAYELPYFGQCRIFEHSSGIVIMPAAYSASYFIPRRVLDEHNGEIEKFLEKKLRKRYKVMGR